MRDKETFDRYTDYSGMCIRQKLILKVCMFKRWFNTMAKRGIHVVCCSSQRFLIADSVVVAMMGVHARVLPYIIDEL